VDILVIMPCRNQHDQAARIRWQVPAPFPMDLLVRTPKNLAWRLAEGESFHTDVMTKGKVLSEKNDARLDDDPSVVGSRLAHASTASSDSSGSSVVCSLY
jgi:hypothetical protein